MQIKNINARSLRLRGRIGVARFITAGFIALGIAGSAIAAPVSLPPIAATPAAVSPPLIQLAPVAEASTAPVLAAALVTKAGPTQAEKLRRLDIMLMVTGLRCRKTGDDFQADYDRFATRHLPELNAAAAELRKQFVKEYGVMGAFKALDQMSTSMANAYGEGHPWLGCHDLKTVTELLVDVESTDTLVEAAGQLLDRQRAPQFAMAGGAVMGH